jgi:hypothetical protein
VSATATSVGGGFRTVEPKGRLNMANYSGLPSNEWDLYGKDPWSVNKIDGNVLIFEDNKERAQGLKERYEEAGFVTYRLHAKMPLQEFGAALTAARNPRSPIVVLVADYAFRSGFTFPVTKIIDTSEVVVTTVQDRKPVRVVRPAYQLERYQAAGRGGRVPGLVTEYYCPESEAPLRICDLEAVEIEAVALVLRVLGYQVPREMQPAVMANGSVPRDLCRALRGPAPLAMIPEMQKLDIKEFFTPSGRRSPFLKSSVEEDRRSADFVDARISADVARKVGFPGIVDRSEGLPVQSHLDRWEKQLQTPVDNAPWKRDSGVGMDSSSSGSSREFEYKRDMTGVVDTINSLVQYHDDVEQLEIGRYYYTSGSYTGDISCAAFPDGVDSVCRWFAQDRTKYAHYGLSSYNRGVALNALLTRYNVRTCELKVLARAIPAAKVRAIGKDLGSLRQWARDMSERFSSVTAEIQVLSEYIVRASDNFCGLVEAAPMVQEEDMGFHSVMAIVDSLPRANMGPPVEMMQAFRDQWASVPAGYITALSTSSSGEMVDVPKLETVPMATTGKGMRAVPKSVAAISYGDGRDRDKRKKRTSVAIVKDSAGRWQMEKHRA